jgi:hypothetical protein
MKIVELVNNIHLPITNEEAELLERFIGDTPIAKSHLAEREQTLANQLTVKDILLRTNEDGKIYYKKRIR